MRFLASVALSSAVLAQSWAPQVSGTQSGLRGVSAVSDRVVWASGTGGTFLRTLDGGDNWKAAVVPGAEALDFRDVHALNDRVAWLMSAGPGDKSRIYKTTDGGATWTLLFTNPDTNGFLDAFAFWDDRRAIVMGDPVNGKPSVFRTDDGWRTTNRVDTPAALPNEGAFAASGTCLITQGPRDAWFVTGGNSASRVFHWIDRRKTWAVTPLEIRKDAASAGAFSIAFADERNGIIVGGDYQKPAEDRDGVLVTTDGGSTWKAPKSRPAGFRSAVVWNAKRQVWIVTGTSGSDVSHDGGQSWRTFDKGSYNALAVSKSGAAWAVGPQGRVARLEWR
jgi:photosystem II stability/assembly factor-like uncharacterized protein